MEISKELIEWMKAVAKGRIIERGDINVDDIVSDAILRLLQSISKGTEINEAIIRKNILYSILDAARRNKRVNRAKNEARDEVGSSDDPSICEDSHEMDVDDMDQNDYEWKFYVRPCLFENKAISEDHRSIFVMLYLQETSPDEVACKFGMAIGSIYAIKNRTEKKSGRVLNRSVGNQNEYSKNY